MITLTYQVDASPLADILSPTAIATIAGEAVNSLIINHLAQRSQISNKQGYPRTGFWAGGAHGNPPEYVTPQSLGPTYRITINHPGISRAVGPVTIRPTKAKALTIPLIAEAYGRLPKEFTQATGKDLVSAHGCLGYQQGESFVAAYVFKRSVTLPHDPTILPSPEAIDQAADQAFTLYLQEH